ncbi:hypothetical protein [Brevundimonas sp. GCM10030266]|uniref:hypothetical protein n=1 Tax=Brevundimonas sp. GCM10030266 TaxID=3273386 RepID=UPI0036143152
MTDANSPDRLPTENDTARPEETRPSDDPQSDSPEKNRQGPAGDPVEGIVQTPPD